MKQVVVITDKEDAHLPFVQKHLNAPMTIIDPQVLLEAVDITLHPSKGKVTVHYRDERLSNVVGVWYRKPRDIQPKQLSMPKDLAIYSSSAQMNHMSMLLDIFDDATWISDYYALRKASNKSLQMKLAADAGFNLPRTIMTSSPARAKKFIETEGKCVVKSLSTYSGATEVPKVLYTTIVNKSKLPDLTNLHLAPSIFQQHIDTVFDIRVTVVGEKIFPAIIRTEGQNKNASIRDWRIGGEQGKITIEPYENFPQKIARACVQHTKSLGLAFGAIDLVMDKSGKLWFLENNPNGQWAFVEAATSQPIGKAIAKMLTHRQTKNR